ncbi:SDR family oxidoreductase [Kibdelosporangium persicum]|uniref:Short-chain alcohol dehydrogenase n=1 Tax=Kibdelosporangium persicum TaxID=2698649 RepID=A0ABX2EVQ4_9PSEU|nr:SDR family oxidoreductase [Kibdelosporangium persicum]NRN63100.1 Short-chain alcohol dehydrogenase [Kibdelosporangium persicum]
MEFGGRHVLITGAASGIGAALADRFAKEGPRGITVVDKDFSGVRETASRVDGLAIEADVGRESEIRRVIAEAEHRSGPIDLFFSNAGVPLPVGGVDVPDDGWQSLWNVHVMAHIWAMRALLPAMIERGEGYLVNTASAAGLVMTPGAAPYTVTKHAALALAESYAVMYSHTGVRFSCLCPGLVETPLMETVDDDPVGRAVRMGMGEHGLDPTVVADIAVRGLIEERFLIQTHPDAIVPAARLRAVEPEVYLEAMQELWFAAQRS